MNNIVAVLLFFFALLGGIQAAVWICRVLRREWNRIEKKRIAKYRQIEDGINDRVIERRDADARGDRGWEKMRQARDIDDPRWGWKPFDGTF